MNDVLGDNGRPGSASFADSWWAFWLAFGFLFLVVSLPVLLNAHPGMADYPNHLARLGILRDLHQSSALREHYWELDNLVPNLAVDVAVPAIAALGLSLEDAFRVFLVVTMATLSLGVVAMARVASPSPPWVCLAIFYFLYNRYFLWGFVAYFFGIGLALCACAAWITMRSRLDLKRIVLFSLICCLLISVHLMSFGVYALAVGGYELTRWLRGRRSIREPLVAGSQFVLPLVFYATAFAHGTPLAIKYTGYLLARAAGFASLLYSGNGPLDVAVGAGIAICLALFAARGVLGLSAATAGCLPLLAVAIAILPDGLMGSGFLVRRLPIVVAMFGLTLLVWRGSSRWLAVWLVCVLVAVSVRSASVNQAWAVTSEAFERYRAALKVLPEGARLVTVVHDAGPHLEVPPVRHVGGFAVLDRHAFIPNLFAYPFNGQAIAFTPAAMDLIAGRPSPLVRHGQVIPWARFRLSHEFMLLIADDPARVERPADTEVLAQGSGFLLLRL